MRVSSLQNTVQCQCIQQRRLAVAAARPLRRSALHPGHQSLHRPLVSRGTARCRAPPVQAAMAGDAADDDPYKVRASSTVLAPPFATASSPPLIRYLPDMITNEATRGIRHRCRFPCPQESLLHGALCKLDGIRLLEPSTSQRALSNGPELGLVGPMRPKPSNCIAGCLSAL